MSAEVDKEHQETTAMVLPSAERIAEILYAGLATIRDGHNKEFYVGYTLAWVFGSLFRTASEEQWAMLLAKFQRSATFARLSHQQAETIGEKNGAATSQINARDTRQSRRAAKRAGAKNRPGGKREKNDE